MIRLIALGGTLLISFSAIFVRLAEVSPLTAAVYRCAYAVPVLIAIHFFIDDERSHRERLLALAAGGLLAADLALWHAAIELVGAGLATVVVNTQVLWVGLLAWLLLGEKPRPAAFAVVPVVLAGIGLIGGVGSRDAYGDNPALGTAVALVGSLAYASFLLLFRRANRGRGTAGPLLDVTLGALAGSLALTPFDSGFSLSPSWPAHGWLLALGILVQVCAWLLVAAALPRLPALDTSVLLLLQPAATVLWARLIFTESLAPLQWAGVAMVLTGIVAAAARSPGRVKRRSAETTPAP